MSPEPVTNWAASLAEDGTVALLLWLAIAHPLAAIAAAAAAVLAAASLLYGIRRALGRLFGGERTVSSSAA